MIIIVLLVNNIYIYWFNIKNLKLNNKNNINQKKSIQGKVNKLSLSFLFKGSLIISTNS